MGCAGTGKGGHWDKLGAAWGAYGGNWGRPGRSGGGGRVWGQLGAPRSRWGSPRWCLGHLGGTQGWVGGENLRASVSPFKKAGITAGSEGGARQVTLGWLRSEFGGLVTPRGPGGAVAGGEPGAEGCGGNEPFPHAWDSSFPVKGLKTDSDPINALIYPQNTPREGPGGAGGVTGTKEGKSAKLSQKWS